LTLLERVLERLGGEYARAGQSAQFAELKIILTAGPRSIPYATLAERLGIAEGTVQGAVHRLRKRYRAILLDEIAATLDDQAGVEEEVRDLFDVLGA
jgi:RNA polymerase sigma-70 factor (ECF subfamily)